MPGFFNQYPGVAQPQEGPRPIGLMEGLTRTGGANDSYLARLKKGRIAGLLEALGVGFKEEGMKAAETIPMLMDGRLNAMTQNEETGELGFNPEIPERAKAVADMMMMGGGLVTGLPKGAVASSLARSGMEMGANRSGKAAATFAVFPHLAERYPERGPPHLMANKAGYLDKKLVKKNINDLAEKEGIKKSEAAKQLGYTDRFIKAGGTEADIPPVEVMKKAGEKRWLSRALTPEAQKFKKTREKVMADMKDNGFDPFFDPAKRTDVNPADYPMQGNTIADTAYRSGVMDKKTKVMRSAAEMQKIQDDLAMHQDGLDRLQAAFDEGLKTKEHSGNWYFMKQLQDHFVKKLGVKEGKKQFKERFAKAMATTTGGADPTSNLLMAAYGNFEQAAGRTVPKEAYNMPSPVSGRYLSGNMANFTKHIGKEISSRTNPKRWNFMNDFLGHKGPTIDEQMSNLFQKGMNQPKNYGAYEKALILLAHKNGVDPRYFQEVAWAGGKSAKDIKAGKGAFAGKPMIQIFNEMVERTSRLTGKTPEEVVDGFVTGSMPMYSGGPTGAAAGVVSAGNMQEPRGFDWGEK